MAGRRGFLIDLNSPKIALADIHIRSSGFDHESDMYQNEKEGDDSMFVTSSRNTLVASAFVFLAVVLLLRLSGGFFEDNIVRVTGAIFAGNAENIPLLDFSTIDLSWMQPDQWQHMNPQESFNLWLHDTIDVVIPAAISASNVIVVQWIVIARADIFGALLMFTPPAA